MAQKVLQSADPTYAKYNPETRLAIGKVIRQEWEKVKTEVDSADSFVLHMMDVLHKAGFKSAAGRKLTERGVRYQIFRNGIRFRKSDRRPMTVTRKDLEEQMREVEERQPAAKPTPQAAPAPQPALVSQTAAPAVAGGMPPVLMAILADPTISPAQREALIKAYYGVK